MPLASASGTSTTPNRWQNTSGATASSRNPSTDPAGKRDAAVLHTVCSDVIAPVAAKGRSAFAQRRSDTRISRNNHSTKSFSGTPNNTPISRSSRIESSPYTEGCFGITFRCGCLHRPKLSTGELIRSRWLSPLVVGDPDAERGPAEEQAGKIPEDLTAALRSAFERNIYNALVARAKAELFETVVQHPRGSSIARKSDEEGAAVHDECNSSGPCVHGSRSTTRP